MKELKPPRAISESSTTSDNTSEFIDIVKKYDVVYNTHNPDYKNVEIKMKVWSQIAEEIGLSVEASKRKWKNLRDSYTKYLRSFRTGTKTSKKYQYWAHAEHMEFLKPYQGPGRHSVHNNAKSNDEDDTECDLGFQVLAKASSSSEEDIKIGIGAHNNNSSSSSNNNNNNNNNNNSNNNTNNNSSSNNNNNSNTTATTTTSTATAAAAATAMATTVSNIFTNAISAANLAAAAAALSLPIPTSTLTPATSLASAPAINSPSGNSCAVPPINSLTSNACNAQASSAASAVVLPLPALPAVPLPPPPSTGTTNATAMGHLTLGKQTLTPLVNLGNTALPLPPAAPTGTAPQIFPLTPLNAKAAGGLSMPATSTASSVGCLIIEPHLFASADTFKKEFSAPTTALGLFQNLAATQQQQLAAVSVNSNMRGLNPALYTKIRRVQPSPQTAAINLSFSATGGGSNSSNSNSNSTSSNNNNNNNNNQQPPAAKTRKIGERSSNSNAGELDVTAVLQANRDLDANTLFFLSLARQVRAMPMKFQSLAKMRCMRIVSDIELELENVDCNGGIGVVGGPACNEEGVGAANLKYCSIDTPPPPQTVDGNLVPPNVAVLNDGSTEHFVYVMSPSRVESMIDISSDDEASNMNGIQ